MKRGKRKFKAGVKRRKFDPNLESQAHDYSLLKQRSWSVGTSGGKEEDCPTGVTMFFSFVVQAKCHSLIERDFWQILNDSNQ